MRHPIPASKEPDQSDDRMTIAILYGAALLIGQGQEYSTCVDGLGADAVAYADSVIEALKEPALGEDEE